MGSWGNCDFSQLKQLKRKIERMGNTNYSQQFIEACAKELTARLLSKVINKTQPGVYPKSSGKKGGTLRRGWTSKTQQEAMSGAGRGKNPKAYANSLPIINNGSTYEIEIINPVHYASYVEYGHRTKDHKGWVPGRFMLTLSVHELNTEAPAVLERKLASFLEECFNDD